MSEGPVSPAGPRNALPRDVSRRVFRVVFAGIDGDRARVAAAVAEWLAIEPAAADALLQPQALLRESISLEESVRGLVAIEEAGGRAQILPWIEGARFAPGGHSVKLLAAGHNTLAVLKLVRELTGLDPASAKALVERAPTLLKEGAGIDEAVRAKVRLERAGATAEVDGGPAKRVLEALRAFADGRESPVLSISSAQSPSFDVTIWTIVVTTGVVTRVQVGGGALPSPQFLGRVPVERARELARAILDARPDAPALATGTPPAPSSVPPVQIRILGEVPEDTLLVSLPASQVALVPALARAVEMFVKLASEAKPDAATPPGVPATGTTVGAVTHVARGEAAVVATPPRKRRWLLGCCAGLFALGLCCIGSSVAWTRSTVQELKQTPFYPLALRNAHEHPKVREALGGDFGEPTWVTGMVMDAEDGSTKTATFSGQIAGPTGTGYLTARGECSAVGSWIVTAEALATPGGGSIDVLH
jgi:large subunit ribosomal protein L7/L12